MKIHNNNYESGLTLLELLIVIAVIGIAATFVIPNISNFATSSSSEKDLATIRSMVDYAKSASYAKQKTIILTQKNKNSIQLFQHNSNDPRACMGNSSYDDEYPKAKTLNSIIYSKHNSTANNTGSYNYQNGKLCFYQDGTTSGGGFEIKYENTEFRMNIWQTGFYDCLRKIKGSWKECN